MASCRRQKADDFKQLLARYRTLPTNFVRDIIMKASKDMMNTLARSVLTLYAYDICRRYFHTKCIKAVTSAIVCSPCFPCTGIRHTRYHDGQSLVIHTCLIYRLRASFICRPDSKYTELGTYSGYCIGAACRTWGGNNSTFTTHGDFIGRHLFHHSSITGLARSAAWRANIKAFKCLKT